MAELGGSHERWIVDDWESVAAELGAELGISRGRACTQMNVEVHDANPPPSS